MLTYISDVMTAPQAIGPYSQIVTVGQLAFLSGQIPIDPATGALVSGGIREQAEQVLKNIKQLLSRLKVDFNSVAKATIFLADMGDFKTVNEIYAAAIGNARPARSTVQVAKLPLGALIEIEMIAELKN